MKKIILLTLGAVMLFTSSCSLWKPYKSTSTAPSDLYSGFESDSTSNYGQLGWRNIFTDPNLQALIDTALVRNSDVRSQQLSIEKAETSYKVSKLAYLPTLYFSPTGQLSNISGDQYNYANIVANASWQIDLFGSITNKKRQAKASLALEQDYKQSIECRLISSLATYYYNLVMLDEQKRVEEESAKLWEENLTTMRALYDAGYYRSPAINQSEAQLSGIRIDLLTIDEQIDAAQTAICTLLGKPTQHVNRGTIDQFQMPEVVGVGVPAQLLVNRPDVRAAERKIEIAYYDYNISRAALFPNITISANGGWTTPLGWVINGIASLSQPIFAGGKLRGNVKIAKASKEQAVIAFEQTVIEAGGEVADALKGCKTSAEKAPLYKDQVRAYQDAYDANRELMNTGTSTYLEVLTAQQSLLSAQLAEISNKQAGIKSLITLYAALGGK